MTGTILAGPAAVAAPVGIPADLGSASASITAPAPDENQDVATLQKMHEEERMAHDLYTTLGATWTASRKLPNIAASELQHMSMVAGALDSRGAAPVGGDLPAGTYAYPDLQALYDGWLLRGRTSMDEAHRVGAELERQDIADLEAAKAATSDPELKDLYARLIEASHRHLAAFEGTDGGPGGGNGPGHGGGAGGGGWRGGR